ncbi:MAG: LysR substrate-binding domain-containing protein [Rudaea sp.]|uniref:LysR substrate-binding domain-containing protein n=1 Tax=Rudaea sp. TaxID=2136325 RepID=UPI0039E64A16
MLRAAQQGQGVALVRHRLAAPQVAAGSLVRPFGERQVCLPQAYWIVRPASSRPPRHAVATLIEWLRSQARN